MAADLTAIFAMVVTVVSIAVDSMSLDMRAVSILQMVMTMILMMGGRTRMVSA